MRAERLTSLVALWVLWLPGCSAFRGHEAMSAKTIQKHGSWVFRGGYQTVARATVVALRSEGFDVPLVNLQRGLLMTQPKVIHVRAEPSWGYAGPTLTTTALQFVVRFKVAGSGRVRVVLEPRILDGQSAYQMREDQLDTVLPVWRRVLRAIYDALPRMPQRPAQPATSPSPPGQPPTLPGAAPGQPGPPPTAPPARKTPSPDTHL